MNCLVCNKKTYPICKKCLQNPFRIEDYRHVLATSGDKDILLNQYSKNLPEIDNLNTSKFWDFRLRKNESIYQQDGMTKERIKTVYSLIPKNAKNILDIGAGHGYLEEYIVKNPNSKRLKLFANDFSKESVKHLKNKYKGSFSAQSIYSLKYANKFFDVVCVLEVLEHIPPSKIFKVLKSIKSLLKKNGTLIVSVPTNEGLEQMKTNPNGHVRTYTIPLITAELELTGYKVETTKILHAFKSNYKIKSLITKVLREKWKPNNIIVKASTI